MTDRIICNPPIGIYNNEETHAGHGFYLTLLDVNTRYLSEFEDIDVEFPSKAYNFFGKRGDRIIKNNPEINSEKGLKEYLVDKVERDDNREKLNLSSYEVLLDDEQVIREGVKKDFERLYEKDLLKERDGRYFLNCDKIKEEYDIESNIRKIDFNPEREENEFRRFIDESDSFVEVTRPRDYSVANPLDGDNIGPLFTLANLWDNKYRDADSYSLACSSNVLCKYGVLRFFSRIGLDKEPGMDEIIVWPRLDPEGGMENWSIDEIVEDKYHGDMLRYSFMRNYSNSGKTKLKLTEAMFKEGRNFVYRVANIRKPLSEVNQASDIDYKKIYSGFRKDMRNKNFQKVLENLYKEVKELSKDINKDKDPEKLSGRYLSLLDLIEPFTPEVAKLGREELNV